MTEDHNKNSLFRQLKKTGILDNENKSAELIPFGSLTGFETSPFNQEIKETKDENENKGEPKIIQKRLNELDNNLFQEGSFLDINDNDLTKNQKVKKLKHLMQKIDEKIFMLEDSDDELLVEKLKEEKAAIEEALLLLEENDNLALKSANKKIQNLASQIHIKEKIRKIEKILIKFCPVLYKSYMVRKALNKLVMLNESAKNLCSRQIPYGESETRYNDFIAYLSCANVIHAKLTKKM